VKPEAALENPCPFFQHLFISSKLSLGTAVLIMINILLLIQAWGSFQQKEKDCNFNQKYYQILTQRTPAKIAYPVCKEHPRFYTVYEVSENSKHNRT